MSNTQLLHEEPTRTNLGPGDRLQAQRIALGLTLEELAKKMRLSVAILKSIEENDFSQISAPIFVKGYLRSYARIVNADENDIITQYITDYTDEDPPISSTSNTAPEINADDTRVKWVTYLVIFALIGLLVVWWWNRYQQPAETLSLDTTVDDISAPVDAAEPVRDDAVTGLTTSQPPITSSINELGSSAGEAPAIEEQAVSAEPDPGPVTATEVTAAEPEPELTEPVQIEPEPMAQAETPVQTDAMVAAAADADLVIRVTADSWVDIKDSEDNQLIYDLAKTGETYNLSGQPPFRVFLGNAPGISISFRGEEVDLGGRIRADNTARIRVGQ